MWTALAKIAVRLIPPEKGVKIALGAAFGALVLFMIIFIGPLVVLLHIPLGRTTEEYGYYIQAARRIEAETGVYVHWQNIMAIDAVLLNQDFSGSSEERAYSYKEYFIREEEVYVERTCTRPADEDESDDEDEDDEDDSNENSSEEEENEDLDEEGEEEEELEEYDCSYWTTHYYARNFDEVLNLLVADGKLPADRIEDVKRYTIFDASPFAGLASGSLPEGWTPVIRDFLWPIENVFTVTSLFGPRTDPFEITTAFHYGIDIGAPTGTPVMAVKDGFVIYANYMGSAGNAVVIKHDNDMESRYYHLSKILVRAGDTVRRGDKIGEVGSTGRSTGPHLHFEIRTAAEPVDPLQYYR